MHELALAQGVVEIAEAEARRGGFSAVSRVVVEIGALAGVEISALRFGFAAASAGTVADGAALEVEATPGTAWCFDCEAAVDVVERFGSCPRCGSFRLSVTGGDAMRVKALEAW